MKKEEERGKKEKKKPHPIFHKNIAKQLLTCA